MSSLFKGYGRGWGEDKASGIARVFQIMREPAGYGTYIACAACMIFAEFVLIVLLGRP